MTPATWDNRWGSFTNNVSLASLNLTTGTHSIWAIAYDKAGAASNIVETRFNFTANSAPTLLQFNPITNTNLRPTDTLSVSGWVNDANGAVDISRVKAVITYQVGNQAQTVESKPTNIYRL